MRDSKIMKPTKIVYKSSGQTTFFDDIDPIEMALEARKKYGGMVTSRIVEKILPKDSQV